MSFKQEMSVFGSYVTYAFVAAVFLLASHLKQFYQLLVAILILYAIVFPIRMLFFKDRPKKESHHDWISKFTANTLISVHSARALILASVIMAYFGFKPAFIALGALAVGMVAVSRYLLRKHRIEDIAIGLLVGAGIALLILTYVF